MEYFNNLPLEITLEILSRVPTEWILDCKLVSKTWRNHIRHSSFSKMHLHHLNHDDDYGKLGFFATTCFGWKREFFWYFEYNENHESETPIERIRRINLNPPFLGQPGFLSSCNGLICLSRLYLVEFTYIFNPITREYIIMDHGVNGFGYVASTDEYKIVRVRYDKQNQFTEVYVYTFREWPWMEKCGKVQYWIQR